MADFNGQVSLRGYPIIVLFIVKISAGIMKNNVSRFGSVLMLSVILAFTGVSMTGCTKAYEPDPDARIPDVPPSTRGGSQGGIPGDAGSLKAKKTDSSLHLQAMQSGRQV
ncbi:hypothetical protein N9B09_00445 [bacterium]|nr:hypothetical protein [bacterium]